MLPTLAASIMPVASAVFTAVIDTHRNPTSPANIA